VASCSAVQQARIKKANRREVFRVRGEARGGVSQRSARMSRSSGRGGLKVCIRFAKR